MDTQQLVAFIEERGHCKPSMDVFSAGCCLAELFTEGCAPFDLTQLLLFRAGEYYPSKVLDKIDDPKVKALIEHMIQRDPEKRLSAADYLEQERGSVFPKYFYSFLWPFLKQFAVTPILSPDEKIKLIKKSIPDILVALGAEEETFVIEDKDNSEKKDEEKPIKKCEALIIITSLITSCL
ncbi:phosphoinositide-3-kinase, regulatory subunit 4, partial [Halocaridina rubra]